jgi:large subunit ribosomal protein L4
MKVQTPIIPDKIKDIKINTSVIHEVVDAILSNNRDATAQSYKKKLTKKKKQKATEQMIARRIAEENLKVVDKIELSEPKTRHAVKFIEDVFGKSGNKVLVLMGESNSEISRSFRNIKNITITSWKNINALNLIENDKILFSQDAWDNFLSSKGLK